MGVDVDGIVKISVTEKDSPCKDCIRSRITGYEMDIELVALNREHHIFGRYLEGLF